jgi:hypothetical protein
MKNKWKIKSGKIITSLKALYGGLIYIDPIEILMAARIDTINSDDLDLYSS